MPTPPGRPGPRPGRADTTSEPGTRQSPTWAASSAPSRLPGPPGPLEPPSRGLPPPPALHTGLPLCCNTPAPFLAMGSGHRLPRLQRRLFLREAGWGRGWELLFESSGGSPRARYSGKRPGGRPGQLPRPGPACPSPRFRVPDSIASSPCALLPAPRARPRRGAPLALPSCLFLPLSLLPPKSFRPRSRARGLRLCKHPPPLRSGQNSEGRGRRPPFPPAVGGGSAAAPGWGEDGSRLRAPPDQATQHTRGGGRGAGSRASGEGGPARAGAGSGWAPAGSGGGVSGYSPAGGRGRPAVWASSPVSRGAGRI